MLLNKLGSQSICIMIVIKLELANAIAESRKTLRSRVIYYSNYLNAAESYFRNRNVLDQIGLVLRILVVSGQIRKHKKAEKRQV